MSFRSRLLPVAINSGYKEKDYYIWCGSPIKDDGKYYLFASRWEKKSAFPDGYMTNSEIVLACTDNLDKPFKFVKKIIEARDGGYWDSMMAHNPYIMRIENKFVLFYIGTPDGKGESRSIGYAECNTIDGEWERADKPFDLPPDANNPCVIRDKDGSFLLYFRDGKLKVSVARSENYYGHYKIIKHDILPLGMVEDMYVHIDKNGKYIMLAEDGEGAYTGLEKGGARFLSDDGINWVSDGQGSAYTFDIDYDNGNKTVLQRRERPSILTDEKCDYLFTSAKTDGDTTLCGGVTWNMVQKLKK